MALEQPSTQSTFSPTKHEKIKKQLAIAKQAKLRATLPVLNQADIRRYRLPYHEAIVADLIDAGYENSGQFIKQLIELQAHERKMHGPHSTLWFRPQLVESKKDLDILSKGLSKAEKAHYSDDFETEYQEMLNLSAKYAFGTQDWWWLGEQLLFQCISMEYPENCQKQETIANYILGKYLLENAKKSDLAGYYLDIAREKSVSKSWNCKKILGPDEDLIFIECCNLLHSALHEEARKIRKTNPAEAAEIYTLARKRAAEACNHDAVFKSIIEKGKCELSMDKSATAIATFTRALNHMTRRKSPEGICEARIHLALAYMKHEKTREALECLNILKDLATKHNMLFYVGQAYRYIGQYYLSQRQPTEATPLLIVAFFIFHRIKMLTHREEVRTLAAISAGEELFPGYVRLVTSCVDTEEGHRNLLTLLRWKDGREPFWPTAASQFRIYIHPSDFAEAVEIPVSRHVSECIKEEASEEEIETYKYDQNENKSENDDTAD